jgi:hypothetical protein
MSLLKLRLNGDSVNDPKAEVAMSMPASNRPKAHGLAARCRGVLLLPSCTPQTAASRVFAISELAELRVSLNRDATRAQYDCHARHCGNCPGEQIPAKIALSHIWEAVGSGSS